MDILKIILLHLSLLAVQTLYMYLSSKNQLKKRTCLYVAAVLPVASIPVVLNMQSSEAYSLYEYSAVFCIIAAAIADVSYSAFFNKDYLTDSTVRSFHYTYFLICTAVAYIKNLSNPFKISGILLLLAVIYISNVGRRPSVSEYIRAAAFATLSIFCAWSFLLLADI